MQNRIPPALAIVGSLLTGGCSEEAMGPASQVSFSFDADSVEIVRDSIRVEWVREGMVSAFNPPAPVAAVEEGRLEVRGIIVFATTGTVPDADLVRTGDLLQMRVFAEHIGIADVPEAWTYRAEVVGLPPGAYSLRLTHEDVDPRTEEGLILNEDFTVPSGG